MKTCKKCGVTYENTEENFYKHPTLKSGYRSICKKCWAIENKENKRKRGNFEIEYDREYIKKLREDKKMSLNDASLSYGIKYHTYINMEKKNKKMKYKNWLKIMKFHGLE